MSDLQVVEASFKSYDDTEIYFQTFKPSQPKALVVGCHGLGEHSDCYRFVADKLVNEGFEFSIFDHRGHGKSEGKRGVGSIDEMVLDLKFFIQEIINKDLPLFILAHSMGGLVAIKYLIRHGMGKARGVVLSSPLLGVTVQIPFWKKSSASLLAKALPAITLHNEIPHKNLTHDQDVVAYYDRDTLRTDRISAPMFMSMLESIDYVFKNSDQLQGQVFFQLSGEDLVVSRAEAEKFFHKLKVKNKKIQIYDGYYHEIYNELKREVPLADLANWLKQCL
ncbi:MAG: alpha/beta hydrolase [Oligoflexia bacterium]|nr:alpha/beta hydrolase [Oligoflexia bacterium]